ncbi:MAG: molybdopterin-dependent oxidoreductase, partial [Chitinophagaceae bacterium]|nr:molybdopterin-dependent oxidoreductase [Rubrivivax sp.]
KAIAASLLGGQRKAVLLGHAAAQHPQAANLLALAHWIGKHTGASVGYLGEGGNGVGAQLVGAMPGSAGLNAGQMLSLPMKALLLLNTEPVLDAADAMAARKALSGAGLVVALTPFKDVAADLADVMLPITPFTETAGTFVNAEGRVQSFHGVVKPLGDSRPGWKVLRVLGNLLGLPGFDFETADEVRVEALGDLAELPARLNNASDAPLVPAAAVVQGLQRVADVPIYTSDAIVRRATSLQLTADARGEPVVGVPSALWKQLGLQPGGKVLVAQGEGAVVLPAREDPSLAANAVRVSAGLPLTSSLGPMFGAIAVEKV